MENCLRPGQEIAVLANAIAVALAKNLTPTEENVIGNLIAQVGATLLAIAATDQACEESGSAAARPASSADSSLDTK